MIEKSIEEEKKRKLLVDQKTNNLGVNVFNFMCFLVRKC